MECMYCERDEVFSQIYIPICTFPCSEVLLMKDQTYRGRCAVAFLGGHFTEVFQIPEKQRMAYLSEVIMVAQVLYELFSPDKINYAIYGDVVSHVHVHLVPKYRTAPAFGEPFLNGADKKILSDADYDLLVSAIREKIQSFEKDRTD
jgi:diadenosine tetraphosphate (Ap4A) HIT family hydrolase